jgi:hypothetical protein
MNQQPDKLFRDKLQNFQKPVPATTWSKLESKLHKKQEIPLWMKVAASVILIASASVFVILKDTANTKNIAKVEGVDTEKTIATAIDKHPQTSLKETISNENTSDIKKISSENRLHNKHAVKSKGLPKKEVTEVISEQAKNSQHELTIIEKQTIAEQIPTEEINTATPQVIEGITLIYSAEEVNAKYLIKKDTSEATSEKEKPSTLQKLWSKAKNLKHNQDPFGELRQKKNEILALDFNKKTQGNQNR